MRGPSFLYPNLSSPLEKVPSLRILIQMGRSSIRFFQTRARESEPVLSGFDASLASFVRFVAMHRRPTAETFDEPLSSFSPIPPLPTSILLRVLFVDSLRQVEIQVRKLKCDRTDNDQLLTDSNTDFESVPQLLEDFLEMVD